MYFTLEKIEIDFFFLFQMEDSRYIEKRLRDVISLHPLLRVQIGALSGLLQRMR